MDCSTVLDYDQLVIATKEQILGSDLKDSTVHGTGFGFVISHTSEARYLQGPPLLVQVTAFTEVVRPHKPRELHLKLSDGDKVVNAVSNGISSGCSLNFDDIHIGFKVS